MDCCPYPLVKFVIVGGWELSPTIKFSVLQPKNALKRWDLPGFFLHHPPPHTGNWPQSYCSSRTPTSYWHASWPPVTEPSSSIAAPSSSAPPPRKVHAGFELGPVKGKPSSRSQWAWQRHQPKALNGMTPPWPKILLFSVVPQKGKDFAPKEHCVFVVFVGFGSLLFSLLSQLIPVVDRPCLALVRQCRKKKDIRALCLYWCDVELHMYPILVSGDSISGAKVSFDFWRFILGAKVSVLVSEYEKHGDASWCVE